MAEKWNSVPADSRPTDCKFPVVTKAVSIAAKNAKMLQSGSGMFAVVLPHDTVEACRELHFRWDDEQEVDFRRIAFVASVDEESSSDECAEEISGLQTVCDLIALPAHLSEKSWDDLVFCGQVGVEGDDDQPTHSLFRAKPADQAMLMQGAPQQLEKPADTLGDREKWFKTRHGSDD